MGRKFFDQEIGVNVNTATLSSAAVTAQSGANFYTYASSGVANDILLPNVSYKGQRVLISVDNNTTSVEANVNTAATGDVFWGSTNNTATVATTASDGKVFIDLAAVTTAAWGIVGLSSTGHWTFAATTGSTGQ